MHRLRNLLAGVVTNVEFVDLVVHESPALESSIGSEQYRQLVAALAHARRSSRDLVQAIRELDE